MDLDLKKCVNQQDCPSQTYGDPDSHYCVEAESCPDKYPLGDDESKLCVEEDGCTEGYFFFHVF